MLTLTDAANKPIYPDDECGVCGATRDEHGDKQHKFSMDGILETLAPAPKARQEPPKERGGASLPPQRPAAQSSDKALQLGLRLTTLLVQRGILDGVDLMYLFGEGEPDAVPERTTPR